MKQKDFFKVLLKEGLLILSGLDKKLNAYRIYKYQDKIFKIKVINNVTTVTRRL